MSHRDKTLIDNNRRELEIHPLEIERVLPEHFGQDYPKLITLLKGYYEFLEQDDEPNAIIHELYRTRDITQTKENLLQYFEDELLLGKAYFEGWINKREAAKFSNTLYRSKGTLYGIQQFFKAFYGIDVDIQYPRDQVLKVENSITDENGNIQSTGLVIGPSGGKITDDTIYQELAILIKSELNYENWRDTYKLFAHPAGMYLRGVIQVVSTNSNVIDTEMPDIIPQQTQTVRVYSTAVVSAGTIYYDETTYSYDSADVGVAGVTTSVLNTGTHKDEIVYEYDSDGSSTTYLDVYKTFTYYGADTLLSVQENYESLQQFLDVDGATFDDSDMSFDNTSFDTFDKDKYK